MKIAKKTLILLEKLSLTSYIFEILKYEGKIYAEIVDNNKRARFSQIVLFKPIIEA